MRLYTPGPWHRDSWRIVSPDDRVLADIRQVFSYAESLANRRLIEAIPDVVEALVGLREWVREPGQDDSPANEQVIDAADAAIAKALGNQVQP